MESYSQGVLLFCEALAVRATPTICKAEKEDSHGIHESYSHGKAEKSRQRRNPLSTTAAGNDLQ